MMYMEPYVLELIFWELAFFVSLGLAIPMLRLAYRAYRKDPEVWYYQKY